MYAIQVEKMRCGGCAARVTRAVLAVDDTAKVDVDLATRTVRVDSDLDAETVAAAITQAGYPASASSLG